MSYYVHPSLRTDLVAYHYHGREREVLDKLLANEPLFYKYEGQTQPFVAVNVIRDGLPGRVIVTLLSGARDENAYWDNFVIPSPLERLAMEA